MVLGKKYFEGNNVKKIVDISIGFCKFWILVNIIKLKVVFT